MLGHLDNLELVLLQEAKSKGKHMTMSGRLVNCNSAACRADLRRRIEDAMHSRDLASTRSDERIYYNGVLRVLRRRLREVEKQLGKKQSLQEQRKDFRKTRRQSSADSTRVLKCAGIF